MPKRLKYEEKVRKKRRVFMSCPDLEGKLNWGKISTVGNGVEIKFVNPAVGHGVFAQQPFDHGDVITEYVGQYLSTTELKAYKLKPKTPEDEYVWEFSRKPLMGLNFFPHRYKLFEANGQPKAQIDIGVAGMANSADNNNASICDFHGDITRLIPRGPAWRGDWFTADGNGTLKKGRVRRIFLVAIKHINPGDEVTTNYGIDYHQGFTDIESEHKKKRKLMSGPPLQFVPPAPLAPIGLHVSGIPLIIRAPQSRPLSADFFRVRFGLPSTG